MKVYYYICIVVTVAAVGFISWIKYDERISIENLSPQSSEIQSNEVLPSKIVDKQSSNADKQQRIGKAALHSEAHSDITKTGPNDTNVRDVSGKHEHDGHDHKFDRQSDSLPEQSSSEKPGIPKKENQNKTTFFDLTPDEKVNFLRKMLVRRFSNSSELEEFLELEHKRLKREPQSFDDQIRHQELWVRFFPHPENERTLQVLKRIGRHVGRNAPIIDLSNINIVEIRRVSDGVDLYKE